MAWQPDRLLAGYEALELPAPEDYDGRVVATLVRLPAGDAPRGASPTGRRTSVATTRPS